MAKNFDIHPLTERLKKEKAIREEREAKANIDWRKKLELKPWQSLKDVELPDEFYESMLIKIENIDPLCVSFIQIICDIFAMSLDYAPYSEEWNMAMKFIYTKLQLPAGGVSPIVSSLAYSMTDIAAKDAIKKKAKTMKEWRETMQKLTDKMLLKDEMASEISSLKHKISELEKKLKEAERIDKHRIEEIDKWHGAYEQAEAEIEMWISKYNGEIATKYMCMESEELNNFTLKDAPQIALTNNSNFARVVQAMVSARYFKRANGDETNATEVGGMLLKLFGVSNTWKSVLQKAYSRENPLRTFDELRDAAEKYWTNRTGLTKEIRKKGKK